MSMRYQDLYETFKTMATVAKDVQKATTDGYTKEVMGSILNHATEMRGELEGVRPDDDTAEAVRASQIPELQNSVGEEIMSVLTHSGRPPQASDEFETLLQAAKKSEELVHEADAQETELVLKAA